MSKNETLVSTTKPVCEAHRCPNCGTSHHVAVEREVISTVSITRCHCRACGHSWHPQVEPLIAI